MKTLGRVSSIKIVIMATKHLGYWRNSLSSQLERYLHPFAQSPRNELRSKELNFNDDRRHPPYRKLDQIKRNLSFRVRISAPVVSAYYILLTVRLSRLSCKVHQFVSVVR